MSNASLQNINTDNYSSTNAKALPDVISYKFTTYLLYDKCAVT